MKQIVSLLALSCALVLATATAADKPEKAPADVAGIWNLTVEFSGGGGNPVFTFKQDGGKLTGRYAGALGEAEVTGTIKGNEIKFAFTIAGQSESVTYTGTVDGDAMKGKVSFGSYGEGTFAGKKQPKK
jgi:hypothetical protein